MAGLVAPADAQLTERIAPSRSYHAWFQDFYEGEYKIALERFLAESRSAIKTGQSRWIDSICYETMCGECFYHMGLYAKALSHYTSALELSLAFPNWMVQVQFPATVRPDPAAHRPVPWGARRLQAPLGVYPMTMLIGRGQIDLSETVQRGGVAEQATFYPIEPQEIVRCTTLAIRRRAQLLGPLAPHDPVFENLVTVLSRRPGPPNHWSGAWIDLQLGLALVAAGREAQGIPLLQRATIAAGEFEHPMTSIAHLELGRLAVTRGDFALASQHFEEASYAAFYYPDPGVLEEAFRYGAVVHLVNNRKGAFAPLAPALAWVRPTRLRQLQASLLMSAAENCLVLGQTAQAAEMLEEARATIGRRQMALGRIGARRNFLTATALFQQKKVAEGETALTAAMGFMRQGSLWLFHISLADNYYTSGGGGSAAARTAVDLYQLLLRDPQPGDWAADPMEALAVLTTPHPLVYERWFEAVLARKEPEAALEVAERTRRHRFLATLSFGGRLEALRWVLEGPKEMLDQQALLQRQDLLTRYPEYDQLRQQAEALRKKLAGAPLVPEQAETIKQQIQGLQQLSVIGGRQQVLLREMAVRREPASLAFPPLRPAAAIQKSLPKGHALLAFFATGQAVYGFLMDRERYSSWPLSTSSNAVGRLAVAMLREMGNYQQNFELSLKDLADTKWKQSARELLEALLKGSPADFATKFDELIVVPDGVLWYVPFEALQVMVGGQSYPLISRFRVRYAPTASLATSAPGWGHRRGNTAVVVGRLYPRLDDEVTQTAVAQLSKAVPRCTVLRSPLPAPSPLMATLMDRLIVLDDLNVPGDQPYGWSPLPLDRNKAGNTLSDWMALPWGGPEEIILPGFHTACEESLKRVNRVSAGNEIFLSVCGLMASGTRTILLSRWRTGGQTSLDLVREFAQELPHTSAADAWQRAVVVVARSRLNLDAEPRIKRVTTEESPRASHPFFWAGYLLVDDGGPMAGSEAAPAPAEVKVVPLGPPVKLAPEGAKPPKAP